jgi:hypothetical protein
MASGCTGAFSAVAQFFVWALSPVPFLALRLIGDMISASVLLLSHDLLFGLWFVVVSLATLASEMIARRERSRHAVSTRRD